jgi:NifU-like protein involved in Fe-S cluster formation
VASPSAPNFGSNAPPSSRSLVAPGLAFDLTLSFIPVSHRAAQEFPPLPGGLDFGFLGTYIGNVEDWVRMINEIYNQRILELAGNIPRLGRLANPDASAKAHSRLCGSTVVIDLCVKDGRVVDFAHDVKACALGQASSSLMARHIIGATAEELNVLRDSVTRMLKANGPPPEGKWAEFAVLEPVRDYKARHASTLLTFDAVTDALAQIAAPEAAHEAAPAS